MRRPGFARGPAGQKLFIVYFKVRKSDENLLPASDSLDILATCSIVRGMIREDFVTDDPIIRKQGGARIRDRRSVRGVLRLPHGVRLPEDVCPYANTVELKP